ncbi:LOW QUALITY PROTEIN: probable disease resistance protein At1g61300 [Prosopis cineraria]|uniref:LOW QUALITY PROTEIN: probable disease resistance protein At1g61300 n=1 Tax=Prosopis cineraria TaxID=364024 RepID=UPI00240FB08A|nr:LOW QUALITY PROTEIN: probable disease resistance protein At1g61300 [Prosopis cineraria]
MTEIIVSIAAKVSEHLVNLTVRQGQYLFRVNKIMKNLESEKKALASTHDHVQKRVEEATHKAERVNRDVSTWMNEVMELIKEVEQLEQEILVHGSCFQGQFPTRKRYILCKQMENKTEAMIQLNKRCQFGPFSFPAPIPDIEHFASGNFEYFKSTRVAADQLLQALQDDSFYIIGVYGMGGSGKTTLVKEVGKEAKELKHFDHVVFATVSQSPNVMKIQDEIADLLGLKLDEKCEAGRARRISVRLQSGERILLILDDVWAKLNLEDIGIPVDGNLKGCKVLLTTRRQEVCNLMDCLKRIPLDLLSEEEAWSLFQKHAGIDAALSSNLLNDVQQEVCKECKGLPIAIVTVGSSLKGKLSAVDEWKVALQSLRDSKPVDVDEGVGDAFNCLKLSYDYLKRDETKLLFLICSMFPEDHEILIDDLIKYGVGLGVCGGSFDSASTQLRVCINILLDSCLLMRCEISKVDWILRHKSHHVKMHDMVRHVALWIASKDQAIISQSCQKSEHIDGQWSYKDCYALSSWYSNGIDKFLNRLDAPKLQILLLNLFAHTIPLGLTGSLELSDESFQGLKELKVLALINKNYQKVAISFPQSLQMLTNLRTLRLVGWDLGDISFVVSLKRLEILDLQNSKFKELPNGITMLDKLKLLDLSHCRIEGSCFKVIRRCSQLEELYAFDYGDCSSPRIMDPYQCFGDDHDVTFPNLQRYKLYLGPLMSLPSELHSSSMRLLYVNGFNPSASDALLSIFCRRRVMLVCMAFMEGAKISFQTQSKPLDDSSEARISQYQRVLRIENPSFLQFPKAPARVAGTIYRKLEELEEIGADNEKYDDVFITQACFPKLTRIEVRRCGKLKSLFSTAIARNLPQLSSLIIVDAPQLKEIF